MEVSLSHAVWRYLHQRQQRTDNSRPSPTDTVTSAPLNPRPAPDSPPGRRVPNSPAPPRSSHPADPAPPAPRSSPRPAIPAGRRGRFPATTRPAPAACPGAPVPGSPPSPAPAPRGRLRALPMTALQFRTRTATPGSTRHTRPVRRLERRRGSLRLQRSVPSGASPSFTATVASARHSSCPARGSPRAR